jgi:hypothetical protein
MQIPFSFPLALYAQSFIPPAIFDFPLQIGTGSNETDISSMFSDILSFNVDPLDHGKLLVFSELIRPRMSSLALFTQHLPIYLYAEKSPENGATSATFLPNQRVRKFEEMALLELRAYEDRMWNEMDPNTGQILEGGTRKKQLPFPFLAYCLAHPSN